MNGLDRRGGSVPHEVRYTTPSQRMPDVRNEYIARRIKDCIGEEAQGQVNVDQVIASDPVSQQLHEFYSASGPPRIIFFCQQHGDLDDEPEMRLFVTDGLDAQLRGKCMYFIRRSYAVEPDTKTPDLDIFFGEVHSDFLESFHLSLHCVFLPLMQEGDGLQDWGKSSADCTKEYLTSVTRFDEMVADAVSSLRGGIELRKPEKRFLIENKQQAYVRASQDPEIFAVYEQIMEEWCMQCEQLLAESAVVEEVEDESGPDTEFEFWRNRMAKFNSVAEQLKTKGCKCVLGVVGANVTKSKSFKRWKQIDSLITDSLNEARDNVKYLSALERYTEALYSGTPASIIEALPALMHNMKVIHTISRFYGTNSRMTTLFTKITNQIITKCKDNISMKEPGSGGSGVRLWDQDIASLLERFRVILKLQDAYWSLYASTKDKLAQNVKGKQFEFNEALIFGKSDLFSKRVKKLLDMFTTIHQFSSLALHNVEGMEVLIQRFFDIMIDFKRKPYDLLDFTKNAFDRDYLEYTVNIGELEQQVQTFINLSFENILSTEQALSLLKQFEMVLVRDSLKSDLDSKYTIIFHNYGLDLEAVQRLYEKQKAAPPLLRNAPPVTGNIIWAKQLLRRIEEPMRRFKKHSSLMSNSKEAKRIVRSYNKVARALVEFEALWHSAWTKSIEAARSGLQATLVIRHPVTDNLLVNFDREILQLIRETKSLQRVKVEVPDTARMVLVHEDKYKSYYNQLSFALTEYERIVGMVVPLMKPLLVSHFNDLENKIQPGMVLLTWQSMNIDNYLQRMHTGLSKFEDLLRKLNDILDHRIEGNLRIISKALLVELPSNESFTLEQFVTLQEKTTKMKTSFIESKNEEIENAVQDVIDAIHSYPLEIAECVSKDAIQALWDHYSRMVYLSVMRCTKESFFALKKRLGSKTSGGFLYMERPFFDVDIELSLPLVTMNPSLDEIQAAINRCALNILRCSKHILQWPMKPPPPRVARSERIPFHHVIAQDYTVVAVCLMLTGAVEGIKKHVHDYLHTFIRYDFLWKEDKQLLLESFVKNPRSIEFYEAEVQRYMEIEYSIGQVNPVHNIGPLSLETGPLKQSLRQEATQWKRLYTGKIHESAKNQLNEFLDFMSQNETKLDLKCDNIDDAKLIMGVLREIRDKEMDMEIQIRPIVQKYQILLTYEHLVEKEELDTVNSLQASWNKVIKKAGDVGDNLYLRQNDFRAELLANVAEFIVEVKRFRDDFIQKGPLEDKISPIEASERMRKYKHLYMERERTWRKYADGEALFGMPKTQYMELDVTRKELELLDKLYTLFNSVTSTVGEYRSRPWVEATVEMDVMTEQIKLFQEKAKKMPRQLRGWDAYKVLTKDIDDFVEVLPLIQALSSNAMRPRHWKVIQGMTLVEFDNESPALTLGGILETGLHKKRDQVETVCLAAERELEVEVKLAHLQEIWSETRFDFLNFKNKGPVLLKAKELSIIFDKVEESTNAIGTMVGHSHSEPFRDEVQNWVKKLTSVQEVLESWTVVQSMWVYMEIVFSNADIAKQLPQEAKRFAGVDKSYMKLMHKAFEISNVVQCCHGHEPMKTVLPNLVEQLDICQKSLNGYFESKRLLFPRFFFISDALLLQILSEGSEPQKIIGHIGMLFDSLVKVEFDKNDPKKMIIMISDDGEHVQLSAPLECEGMAEEYLENLVASMRTTINSLFRTCVHFVFAVEDNLMEELFLYHPGQVGLMGLQIYWTFSTEEALLKTKQDKLIMSNTAKKFEADLRALLTFVKKNLGPSQRTKLESMITVHLHQKEAFDDFVKNKIKDTNDFEWQKQLRFDWKSEESHVIVKTMDTSLVYQNEFIGCKERLVVTSLTNRCCISIFQALSMNLGVANFGPAGMGKTMVIRDISRILGKYAVIFNCSNQLGVGGLAKILKGVAMTGCWGCFDDFSRVELNTISVAAEQMSIILFAKRAKSKHFVFPDGDNGSLDANAAYFMTLLPSKESALPLPENMKTQVRGVMMLSPDPAIIIRVKLTAAGYKDAAKLSTKLHNLYEMCKQCLSKQEHYDFGLRNMCSLAVACGRNKRQIQDDDLTETQMVVHALKETNLACLTQEDCVIFLEFLTKLFPGVSGEKLENVKQSNIMRAVCESMYLEYDAISAIRWVEKLTYFHETCQVRHGLGLVGPSGGGKTMILKTCIQTLSEMKGVPQTIKTLNPKAVELSQIFGYHDLEKSKWSEGNFSALWRQAAQNQASHNWIVFDGPVDLEWMENLNTALDDTKVLTLANGDRLPVPDNLKILLETDHLQHASPAAVSRIGIVFVSLATLGYEALVSSWLKSRPESQCVLLTQILDNSLSKLVNISSRIMKPVVDVSPIVFIGSMLQYLEILLSRGQDAGNGDISDMTLERMVVFSICWSFGGPVESDGRSRLEVELKKLLPKGLPAHDVGKVFDCYLDKTGQWQPVAKLDVTWQFPGQQNYFDVYVPTTHNMHYRMLFEMVSSRGLPVLLLGGAGVSKTSTILQFMRDRASNDGMTTKRIVLSADTSPGALQRAIESATEKRQGRIYGPSNYRKCCVLIDDINMPRLSKWGDQPASELFRQLISDKGFFNLEKPGEWKLIKDLEFFAAMTHPGGGRQDLPSRLRRRTMLINMSAPSRSTIEHIYSTIVNCYFSETRVGADTANTAVKLALPTVNLWSKLQDRITPTASKFHYKYTMHDLSNVFCGMLRCHPDTFDGKEYVARLWKHECERAFTDKLSSAPDKFMVNALINDTLEEALGKMASKCQGPYYFCTFVGNEEDKLIMNEKATVERDLKAVQTALLESETTLRAINPDDIQKEKEEVERDLEVTKPALLEAEDALNGVKAADIKNLMQVHKPSEVIKIIFDGVLLLCRRAMIKCTQHEVKGEQCYVSNYEEAQQMMRASTFLQDLRNFPKECITAEDCELLAPYVDHPLFIVEVAAKVSDMAICLCRWVKAMVTYHHNVKAFIPKIDSSRNKETALAAAKEKHEDLKQREEELVAAQKELADAAVDPDALFQPYEICYSFQEIQGRVKSFLDLYNQNPDKMHKMDLVLFPYAVEQLLKIVRAICMDGGSCLLIGLRASGKQSLATLATFILEHRVLRIRPSKLYTKINLLDDLKSHCKYAALNNKHFSFILTEADILDESFLDLLNQLVFTGEITDMFTKDEINLMVGEASFRSEVQRHRPEWSESTENLIKFFVLRIRCNFHCIVCLSQSDPNLMTRIRCYPALSGCHLIWFMAWPSDGLEQVADHSFLKHKIKLQHKELILRHLPEVQELAQTTTTDYFNQYGRRVHVTPVTYLLFLETYAHVFSNQESELQLAIKKFKGGLQKLDQVGEDIKDMLEDIEESEHFLAKAQAESATILKDITTQQSVAERKKKTFEEAAAEAAAVRSVVTKERDAIEKELQTAEPYLRSAEEGLNQISAKDLHIIKALKNPPVVVKVILDAVLILLQKPLVPIKIAEEKGIQYYRDSYAVAFQMMNDGTFLDKVQNYPRDNINDESVELLQPYLENPLLNVDTARKASSMAAGLCIWVQSLDQYLTFARIVKPRRTQLFYKEIELAQAKKKSDALEADLNSAKEEIAEMQRSLDDALSEKNSIQKETDLTRDRVKRANLLIRALSAEKTRWMTGAGDYTMRLAALPGDASLAACFLAYCGPLSKDLRLRLFENVQADLKLKKLPNYKEFNLSDLLSSESERGDWTMQGLPEDAFSIQNGLLVTKSLRWPLLIDPEGQGLDWITRREKENMLKITTFGNSKFAHILEECVSHGRPLLVENVNDRLDPTVESILDKRYSSCDDKEVHITIGDNFCTYNKGFALFLRTKVSNPDFTPEMSSQVTVVNFKLSIDSLQEQLFAQILEKERPVYQSDRRVATGESNALRKRTLDLESDILTRLYNIKQNGSILDDDGLLLVLEEVKDVAKKKQDKETMIDGISKKIDLSCAPFREVAKRAGALYSVMLDLAYINPMYTTSLQQFKLIYQRAVASAKEIKEVQKKVEGMNQELTWIFFRSLRRGIFEQDKELFALLMGLKIIQFDGSLTEEHFSFFIYGGSSLNAESVRQKPYNWLPVDAWLNVMALQETFHVLKDLPDSVQHLGDQWRSWFDNAAPEAVKLPDIPSAFDKITPFLHLCIVRAIRPDRTTVAARRFVKEILGENYNGAPDCNLEAVYLDTSAMTPLIFLLSPGADPTGPIHTLGRKLKKEILSVSMGQGQEIVAQRNFKTGIQIGNWVLIQNVHLDIGFLYELEQDFYKGESINDNFRMFMTTEVTPAFPLGLLQMSVKMSSEPPAGVKAGLRNLYSLINQDLLEALPRFEWRSLLFSLAFMHSVMLARRRFGRYGWSAPCEFNHADFISCATFLQNHIRELESKRRKEINWETLRNMIVQIFYGGNRSDVNDLRLLQTLSEKYISPLVLETNFQFAIGYSLPTSPDINSFRASIESYPALEKLEVIFPSPSSSCLCFEFVFGLEHAHDVFKKLTKTLVAAGEHSSRPLKEDSSALPLIEELLQKLPHPWGASEIRESLEKDGGESTPMNVAFKHELDVFNHVLTVARNSLAKIQVVLTGQVPSSNELNQTLQDIYFNRVPQVWEDVSWPATNLGQWIYQMQNRLEQWKRLLERGRPFSFWLAGFSNPVGFLSSIKQEAVIKQKNWALENCVLFTEMTKLEPADLKAPPENGVYVHGLYLDGAAWNKKEGKLIDSPPKVPTMPLPALYICVVEKSAKKYDFQVYECPCYARKVRGNQTYVFSAELKTEELPSRWILRGVAIICSLAQI